MRRVAILGASADRAKFGNKSVRAHRAAGWSVVPVNPRGGDIEGLPAARSLAEIAEPIGRISVYLHPEVTRRALPDIAAARADEIFFNPGSIDAAGLAEAERLGLPARSACSIVDVGFSPAEFPDD